MERFSKLFGLASHKEKEQSSAAPETGPVTTRLHLAAKKGDTGEVDALLRSGADVNARDDRGRTPAMLAAGKGNTFMVLYLLKHGANPNAKDIEGKTALNLAATRSQNVMNQLFQHTGQSAAAPGVKAEAPQRRTGGGAAEAEARAAAAERRAREAERRAEEEGRRAEDAERRAAEAVCGKQVFAERVKVKRERELDLAADVHRANQRAKRVEQAFEATSLTCMVCLEPYDNGLRPMSVLLPCRHIATCCDCAEQVLAQGPPRPGTQSRPGNPGAVCPLCRTSVDKSMAILAAAGLAENRVPPPPPLHRRAPPPPGAEVQLVVDDDDEDVLQGGAVGDGGGGRARKRGRPNLGDREVVVLDEEGEQGAGGVSSMQALGVGAASAAEPGGAGPSVPSPVDAGEGTTGGAQSKAEEPGGGAGGGGAGVAGVTWRAVAEAWGAATGDEGRHTRRRGGPEAELWSM